MEPCSSTEFGVHIFKRRASGQEGDRYTIGVWESTYQRAICHDACIDCALAAVRAEMENAGPPIVARAGMRCHQQSEIHATRHNEELPHRQCP